MKPIRCRVWLAVVFLALAPGISLRADDETDRQQKKREEIDAGFLTVFYAVLEGCFTDGLADEDVDQILRREDPEKRPVHFIYACPVCMATERALETYRARANSLDKIGKLTFGKGLAPEIHARLYSDNLKVRLAVIHDLEEAWVSRRVDSLRLNPEELARTQAQLRAARDEGMRMLQTFLQEGSAKYFAPGYHEGDECALCNAAADMKLKLAEKPANP